MQRVCILWVCCCSTPQVHVQRVCILWVYTAAIIRTQTVARGTLTLGYTAAIIRTQTVARGTAADMRGIVGLHAEVLASSIPIETAIVDWQHHGLYTRTQTHTKNVSRRSHDTQ